MNKEDLKALIFWSPVFIVGIIIELWQLIHEIIYKIFHGGKSPWIDDYE